MAMCYEKMMTGWRNTWSMKQRVQDQEEDQRGPGERLLKRTAKHVKWNKDAVDSSKWRKFIKDVRWSGWVWVGECFFWYRPTRVVPEQRPLNGCVCVCVLRMTTTQLCSILNDIMSSIIHATLIITVSSMTNLGFSDKLLHSRHAKPDSRFNLP